MSARRLELKVPPSAAGTRLDRWLAAQLEHGSRADVQRLLEADRVLVDGASRAKGYRLAGGEQVSADLSAVSPSREPAAAEPRVVWEDEHLLIVDKPAGLVVHPAPGHRSLTLVDLLAAKAGGEWEPQLVHRLDRNTSGLLLVAKTREVRDRLQDALRRRQIARDYLTLVRGGVGAKSGTIDAPLGRDRRRRTRMSTRTDKPREARTHFTVERFIGDFTLVRARLETGRTHQIRAHFAALGHPVCGDPEYGGAGVLGLRRQFLHSTEVSFAHPATSDAISVSSPLPADLEEALARAGAA